MFGGIMDEKFPKLMTDAKPQIQETQRLPERINTKIFIPIYRYISYSK